MSENELKAEVFARCPYCGTDDNFCVHFLGWTDDGRTVSVWPNYKKVALDPGRHKIYKTGVSCRVYSENVYKDLIDAGDAPIHTT